MVRTFLALEIPEAAKKKVAGLIQEFSGIPSKVKWVTPDQIHLTLKFFGSVSLETVDHISRTLGPVIAEHPRFCLTLKELGGFPNLFRPRVIWLGVGGDTSALTHLQRDVEEALAAVGIPREERPFRGHITLGRNKAPMVGEDLAVTLKQRKWEETAPLEIEGVTLFRSDLKPSGPHYTSLQVFSLKAGGETHG